MANVNSASFDLKSNPLRGTSAPSVKNVNYVGAKQHANFFFQRKRGIELFI